jgi:hypothetical protein
MNKKCPRCNLNLKSSRCEKLHKSICYGVGHFGWYCDKCNHFTYKSENYSSEQIKNLHECGFILCRLCRKTYNSEDDSIHLCPLRLEKPITSWQHLAFLNIEFLDYNVNNCSACYELKNDFKKTNSFSWKEVFEHKHFPELACELHITNEQFVDPLLFIVFKEHLINKGQFFCHVITNCDVDKENYRTLNVNYFYSVENISKFVPKKQLSFFQKTIKSQLQAQSSLIAQFLSLILDEEWSNTTFIIQDPDSFKMVNEYNY